MKNSKIKVEERERSVIKYTTTQNVGVEPTRYSRNLVGYVIKGEKYIHEDDRFHRVAQGDIFFLGQGTHYIENIPMPNESFEQIVFYFSPERLQQIFASLDINSLDIDSSPSKASAEVISATPSKITTNFFTAASRHYDYGGFLHNSESERLHLTELALNILYFEDQSVKSFLLQSLDQNKAEFERVIFSNLLNDKSVEELADECHRSLTAFKKEFKRIFNAPPHQWYLRQRLNYAKLLLSTTRESISQVGNSCAFPNTSHFIKLFKRHFGSTPAVYRAVHNREGELEELRAVSHPMEGIRA